MGNDSHLAKDVAQQVFISLARKAPSLSIRSNLAGWLYRRTRSSAIDLVRKERRRRNREVRAQSIIEIDSQRPTPSDWNLLRPVLEDTIDQLKPDDRETVAQKRAERALEKIRYVLGRRGMTCTASMLAQALANQVAASVPEGLSGSIASGVRAGSASWAAAGLASTFITFMSTTKLGMGVAGLVTVFALGTAVFEVNEVRESRAALAAAQKTHLADGRIGVRAAARNRGIGILRRNHANTRRPKPRRSQRDSATLRWWLQQRNLSY